MRRRCCRYDVLQLYDGLGSWDAHRPFPKGKGPTHWSGEFDQYDQWFEQQLPGKDPQATLDYLDGDGWNGWHGRPYVYEEYYHPTAWVGRQAVGFIESRKGQQQPFMAKVSFHRPHSPYDPPKRLFDAVREADLPPIYTTRGDDAWDLRFRGQAGDPPGCGPTADAWCGLMPAANVSVSRRAYYASIAFVDEQVGAIYQALENTSMLESTFIMWTADHGDGQGDHYHWRKGYPYEFSAHVPFLLRWPASPAALPRPVTIARGTVITDLVSELRDVLHTAVDIAGAQGLVPAGHFQAEDGKSLLCLLQDPSGKTCAYSPNPGPWRKYIDMEHSTCYNASNHWNALTDGKIKYVFRANYAAEQLFNLTSDPHELDELSADPAHAGTLKLWRGYMVKQFEQEGRGPAFVQDGVLQQRTKGQTYSPNYPGGTPSPHPKPKPTYVPAPAPAPAPPPNLFALRTARAGAHVCPPLPLPPFPKIIARANECAPDRQVPIQGRGRDRHGRQPGWPGLQLPAVLCVQRQQRRGAADCCAERAGALHECIGSEDPRHGASL